MQKKAADSVSVLENMHYTAVIIGTDVSLCIYILCRFITCKYDLNYYIYCIAVV